MIYTILTPVREVRKRLKIAGLILAINLNLLSLSIVAAAAAALHPLDYRDIGAYIRTPVIAFAAGDAPVNFIDIHREMAILEFASHARLNSKDKTKNLSLLRITPVYVDDTKGGTYKIHTRLGREKVVEFVFCSSSSPSLNPEVEG
ncbi:MAG: hypothetical protein Q8Q56_00430, partial [Alphaproteobacteria bacterium]|nr:hypothetical protein [Alphaproteobacteria bacterium]